MAVINAIRDTGESTLWLKFVSYGFVDPEFEEGDDDDDDDVGLGAPEDEEVDEICVAQEVMY